MVLMAVPFAQRCGESDSFVSIDEKWSSGKIISSFSRSYFAAGNSRNIALRTKKRTFTPVYQPRISQSRGVIILKISKKSINYLLLMRAELICP